MNYELCLLIYREINKNSDISSLEKIGYSYAEIAANFSEMINCGYVEPNEDMRFVMSTKGYDFFSRMEIEEHSKNGIQIKPFDDYRIEKMGKYDIFIE